MFVRIYLIAVAVLYMGLALWCTIQPDVTSKKVGFQLTGGSGKSEFITVYGGLELAMALLLIAGVFRAEWLSASLFACVVMHACLVLFRTYTLIRISDIDGFTYRLAIGEWVILLVGLIGFYQITRNS